MRSSAKKEDSTKNTSQDKKKLHRLDESHVVTVEKTIGDTVYIVENVISENARQTVYEKVKRLILNDSER